MARRVSANGSPPLQVYGGRTASPDLILDRVAGPCFQAPDGIKGR